MKQFPRMRLGRLLRFAVSQNALASREFKPDLSLLQPRNNREHQQLGTISLFFANIALVGSNPFSWVPGTRHVLILRRMQWSRV